MAIELSSFLIPKNSNTFYLLEDKYVKGGLHTTATHTARDLIDSRNRKPGMLVVTQNDMKVWQLDTDMTTWNELVLGSSTGNVIPVRMKAVHTTNQLVPGGSELFAFQMGKSCILYDLTVDVGPCTVQGHGLPTYSESNPYTFTALSTHLSDDGTTFLSDGTAILGRRYTVLMNMEDVPTNDMYWKITNTGSIQTAITATFSFLPLE